MKISVVVPMLNESASIEELASKIKDVAGRSGYESEIIFIDDGSTDDSFEIVKRMNNSDPEIKGISFGRNYGKAAALSTGFKAASGDLIITMDADLQDDPEEIPGLVKMIKDGADLVSGWKKKRYDPVFLKLLPSKFFNLVTSIVSGIRLHDFNCGLKAYRAGTAKSLEFYGEMHRYLPVLAHWSGFRVAEKVVKHRKRKHGKTKYGPGRFLHGFFDLMTITFLERYARRPLHLFGLLGLLFFFAGIVIKGYFMIEWIMGKPQHLRPAIMFAVGSMILGIQFFSLGLLGEMVLKSGNRENYIIIDSAGISPEETV